MKSVLTGPLRRFALAACVMAGLASSAQAQTSAEYRLFVSADGIQQTPDPLPPVITLSQGGQLSLHIDSDQTIYSYTTMISYNNFVPAIGGTGGLLLDVPNSSTAIGSLVAASSPLQPGGNYTGNDSHNFILTFGDAGIYTITLTTPIQIGSNIQTLTISVLPTAAGPMVLSGNWNPAALYPQNSVVTTGSFTTGYDFWVETNPNGAAVGIDPKSNPFQWTHINGATAGAQGPAGPQGPIGPAGPDGNTGAQGPVGPVGPAGAQGASGPQGAVGPIGPVGPQGTPGLPGAVGPIGPVGPQGKPGLPGAVGPAGPQGATGLTGAAGPIGPVGPQGASGPQGAVGPQGTPGIPGAIGPMGPMGPQGPGLISGSLFMLPASHAAPAGATLIGSSEIVFLDSNNHLKTLAVRYYQLP